MVKKTEKTDKLGMAPAVHRKQLEDKIKEINKRIDELEQEQQLTVEDFGDVIDEVNKKLDKVCGRMGLPKS